MRLRLGPNDARYAGGLVAGAKAMEIFGDLETEIALREGGDEGLCAAYDMVEFLAPLRVGDFIEATARVVERGNTSRKIALRAPQGRERRRRTAAAATTTRRCSPRARA